MKIYTKDHYSLRRFLPVEWRSYRDIRLEALKTDPQVFGSNYDKEFQYSGDEWRSILANPARAFFALRYFDEIVGVTGAFLDNEDATRAVLVASFIRPGHRGKGLSSLFYEARLDWVREQGCKSVIVSHRSSNLASKAANQRFGFEYTHSELKTWPDGVEAESIFYRLDL